MNKVSKRFFHLQKYRKMTTRIFFSIFTLLTFFLSSCELQKKPPCDCEKLRVPAFTNEVIGAEAVQVNGRNAGYPLDSMPGIKTISTAELLKMKEEPKTGLYLLDTDFVPQELARELKEEGYTLKPDGTLDSAGVKITLFVQAAVYQLKHSQKSDESRPGSFTDETPVTRASPLPWAGYSCSFWWKYNGGFCRSYEARTRGYTYGPNIGGFWPITNVQLIQTGARVGASGDNDNCQNCHYLSSYDKDDIGCCCFWPAHGGNSGNHYLYIYDSGTSVYLSWGWSH